ncbi:MAG: DMT family transporter [Candidatus Aenigmatarchaeota archaeon]|nr:MAG: DMT family transporter [Candidatus Aenigmarchaeota archaeon]
MVLELGVLAAFGAMLFWGFGDFLIQRTTRRIGDWEELFAITAFSTVALLPFIYKEIPSLFSFQSADLPVLSGAGLTLFLAGIFYFEALKKSKIAVVEPVLALEVPITILLAFSILRESLTPVQLGLSGLILAGIVMVAVKAHHLSKQAWLERGVWLAVAGAFFMSIGTFLVGLASRVTDPLVTIWFAHGIIAMLCGAYIFSDKRRIAKLISDVGHNPRLVLSSTLLDNGAWVLFAYATSLIPIAISVALSESYIALAALLGLLVNKERLLNHQKIGLVVTLAAAITLAVLTA